MNSITKAVHSLRKLAYNLSSSPKYSRELLQAQDKKQSSVEGGLITKSFGRLLHTQSSIAACINGYQVVPALAISARRSRCTHTQLRTDDCLFTDEVCDILSPTDGVVLDLTFGSGGHSEALLANNPRIKVIAVDCDPEVQPNVGRLKQIYPGRFCFLNIKFR